MKITMTTTEIKNIVARNYGIDPENFTLEISEESGDTPVDINFDQFLRIMRESRIEDGSSIPLVKMVRQTTGFSLFDSKKIVDEYRDFLRDNKGASDNEKFKKFNSILTKWKLSIAYFYEMSFRYSF